MKTAFLNKPATILSAFAVAFGVFAASPASAQSSAYCDDYARDYADARSNAAGNVVGGAAAGALGGAIIGGIIGGGRGAGRGALIGGGVGAVGGAAGSGNQWRYHYDVAFDRCMSGADNRRTYRASAPEPWTDEWFAYCEAKYRSFRASDGTFQPYNGPRRLCR